MEVSRRVEQASEYLYKLIDDLLLVPGSPLGVDDDHLRLRSPLVNDCGYTSKNNLLVSLILMAPFGFGIF